ncbi:MAG: hypothetical protein ACO3JL_04825 [Myxococcota bacterium]
MKAGSADGLVGLVLLLPVVAALCFSGLRFVQEADDVPADRAYEVANDTIESWGFSLPHDAVAVLPAWSLRAHRFLRHLEPLSGDVLAERPLDRVARLFVLVEPDGEDAFAALLARLGAPAAQHHIENLTLYRFDLRGPFVAFDLTEALAEAEVALERSSGDVLPCDLRTAAGVSCNGAPTWQRVTREHLLLTENGQRALWAHPPPAGETLVLRWRDTPPARELVFSAGFTRKGAGGAVAPVMVDLSVGGTPVASLQFPPRFAFTTHRIALPLQAQLGGEFQMRVRTENNEKSHWAFDAFLSRGGAP